ncbi:MAG: hypothetical protein JWM11_6800 [Planctomycetaceae bacterium]|nr:hypothetical protein [Planctomycetaceae bacterium]
MLFAVIDLEADFYKRLNVYLWTGIALFAIGLLIWASLRIRSWFFDSDESEVPTEEMLTQFRQLKLQGELSDEEFRLISQRLAGTNGPPVPSERLSTELRPPLVADADKSTDVKED